MADFEEAGPEDGAADEDADALHGGGGEVVGEGQGYAEGAGAGDDQQGDHDLEASGGVAGVNPPGQTAEDGQS